MKDTNIFNKFSKHLKTILVKAQDLASGLHKKEIDFWEIFYALTLEKGSVAFSLLGNKGCKAIDFKREAIKVANLEKKNSNPSTGSGPSENKVDIPIFSDQSQKIIEKAVKIAYQSKHVYIGSEHLLSAILNSNIKDLDKFFKEKKINKNEIIKDLKNILLNTSKLTDLIDDNLSNVNVLEKMIMGGGVSEAGVVPQFTIELTSAEIQHKIDPVIGRNKEIDRLIQILSRRTKNNPVLLGEPGVGKTAIIEGLAKRIFEGKVPDVLLEKKIISLDLGAVIAGTIYRGEFEKRLKKIIDDAKHDDNIILFIDEIHTLVGTGATSGQLDAANLLKPELAKGDLKVIGATTVEEYRKYIESDAAFERRFQSIIVDESTAQETKAIIKGLRNNYEKYHLVKITDEAIKAAIELSQRYLPEKFLPDKAIDLIDEAASKFKVKNLKNSSLKKVIQLKNDLQKMSQAKDKAIENDNYERAVFFRENEDRIIKELEVLSKDKLKSKKFLGKITASDIAEIISKITGVPLEELLESEKKKFINLEKFLTKKIIGQDEVIKNISEYIRRAKAGLANPNKPLASFIFLGPSGVGKTETAKVLAREVYNSEKALFRIDMSEFSDKIDTSKLIGAPAGYVGYKDSNKFTDQVRMKPYSVVLFDEIEKAHPDIFNLLLPVLEDGYITDATGRVINFKNTIIIMTSNIGNEQFNKRASIGFDVESKIKKEIIEEEYESLESKIVDSLADYFKPEFLNRLDKIFAFKPINVKNMSKIAKLEIKELEKRLKDKKISIELDDKIYKYIAVNSFNPQSGARPLKRFIQDKIENLIANQILADTVHNGDNISIYLDKNEIKMKINN
jgi:ATP-dependent Clp protease ATP-binding subunit ClpC